MSCFRSCFQIASHCRTILPLIAAVYVVGWYTYGLWYFSVFVMWLSECECFCKLSHSEPPLLFHLPYWMSVTKILQGLECKCHPHEPNDWWRSWKSANLSQMECWPCLARYLEPPLYRHLCFHFLFVFDLCDTLSCSSFATAISCRSIEQHILSTQGLQMVFHFTDQVLWARVVQI